MKTYECEIIDGHLIIRDNGNVILIDTGAPKTIHGSQSYQFLGREFDATDNYMGLDIPALNEQLGFEVTTLMGADILSEYRIVFDYPNHTVSFLSEDDHFAGEEIVIDNFMGIPVIAVSVLGNTINCFLDTGAKLSYLKTTLTEGQIAAGHVNDFYPGFGSFETDFYNIETNIGNISMNIKYGNMPQLLELTLMMGGAEGIIGFDFFNSNVVYLDLKDNILKIQ